MRLRPLDFLAAGLTLGYVATQLRFLRDWQRTPHVHPATPLPRGEWSVVIAARDEAGRLGETIKRIAGQAHEIIVIDDHSLDATAAEARASGAKVLSLPPGQVGKKAALTYGIAQARGSWIATADADVHVPPGWLAALESTAEQHDAIAVAGPVMLGPTHTWFGRWQALDFCGMMAITAASLRRGAFAMGNGANLAFRRAAFDGVDGYSAGAGGRESASGDDMVLLGKLLARYPGRVAFAKTRAAAVVTPPEDGLAAFVRQRWRWSAKTGLGRQPALTATLAGVWAFHLGLCLAVPLAAGRRLGWGTAASAWAAKSGIDYALLRSASRAFGRGQLLDWTYPAQSLAHALYVAGVGTLALLPLDYTWKGRRWRV